jgi:hypothetical protein
MRYRGKIDTNQHEIVQALRTAGAVVQSLAAVGHGVPDLLVAYRGGWYVMEIKAGRGKLTPDEQKWIDTVGTSAPVFIVRSAEDALRVVGAM